MKKSAKLQEDSLNRISDALAKVDLSKPETINAAASEILAESLFFSKGDTICVIDDPTFSYAGQKGKVVSEVKQGMVDIELENGVTVPMFSNLLLKIS